MCDVCTKCFSEQYTLKKHLRMHTGGLLRGVRGQASRNIDRWTRRRYRSVKMDSRTSEDIYEKFDVSGKGEGMICRLEKVV